MGSVQNWNKAHKWRRKSIKTSTLSEVKMGENKPFKQSILEVFRGKVSDICNLFWNAHKTLINDNQ